MPWQVSDVESHKKGLSDSSKKQWVNIANSMLKKCMEEGGDEETCAISAIKGANGSVNTNEMEVYSNVLMGYVIRTKVYQERNYIIVPVVMMVEGVHNGSAGPLLHKAEDLGRFPASWDGIPVMIDHPQIDGMNVSANIPEILEMSVGRVFNTNMQGEKLKAELWLDEQKLIAIAPEVADHIQKGKSLDVSVGVFTEEEPVSGIYINANTKEEEEYSAIARNHRPDHLAILPNGISGACGWKDGCGIRVNSENREHSSETIKKESNDMINDVIVSLKQIAEENILASITDNRQGFQELMSKVSEKLCAKDSEDEYHILEEVYTDSVIYRKRGRAEDSGFYHQSYQVNEDGIVEFVDSPTRVRRDVNYVQMNALKRTKFSTNKKGGIPMAENDKPCCLEKVVELLNNKQLGLTEADDREWLLGLGPERLERITPKAPQVIEVNKEVIVEVQEPVETDLTDYVRKDSFKTAEDVLAIVPEEMKEQFQSGLRLHEAYRGDLVKSILDFAEPGVWTEDELKVHNTAMLEKLSKQFKQPVNYAGQNAGVGINVHVDSEEKLLPLGIN
jgi:hypothetical protein